MDTLNDQFLLFCMCYYCITLELRNIRSAVPQRATAKGNCRTLHLSFYFGPSPILLLHRTLTMVVKTAKRYTKGVIAHAYDNDS